MSKPQWNDGAPQNLEAAAADAGEWLDLIERLVMAGVWSFLKAESLPKLRACIQHLELQLENSAKEPK